MVGKANGIILIGLNHRIAGSERGLQLALLKAGLRVRAQSPKRAHWGEVALNRRERKGGGKLTVSLSVAR